MRDIIVTLVVLGLLPSTLLKPHIGVYLWAWISYMNPHRLGWGFAYSMPFALMIAVATILGLFLTKEKRQFPINIITVLMFFFVCWVTITSSVAFNDPWVEWERFIKIQVMTLVTIMVVTSKRKLDGLIWVIAVSVGFFGIKGGVFAIASGGNYRVWGPEGSFFYGNNELALALIMVLPLFWYLTTLASNKWIRYALYGSLVLMVFSILSSYSRGAFLALSAIGLLLILKSKRKLLYSSLFLVLALVAASFMPDKWFDRMNTIQTYEQDDSAMGRINAWWFAWNLAVDNPVTGGGFGAFRRNMFLQYAPDPTDYHDAHSIYFEVLGEQGFVGLGLFLGILLSSYFTAYRVKKRVQDKEELKWAANLLTMTQIGIVGYCVGGLTLGLAYFDLPYHLIAIIVIVKAILDSAEKKEVQYGRE